MSRALAMPVKGKVAWRTCRNCDRRMRIERFAPAEMISGYGPHCYPCRRAVTQREARLVHVETKRDRAEATRRAVEMIPAQKNRLTDTALDLAQEMADLNHARTNGDTRYHERLRQCLGPCREMWLSPSCEHRFCPGCSRMADRNGENSELRIMNCELTAEKPREEEP